MHRAWADFATNGHPGWEQFTPDTRRIKLFDGTSNTVVTDPRPRERNLWPAP